MLFNYKYIFATFCVCFLFALQFAQAEIVCPTDQPDDSLVVQFPSPTSCNEFILCDRGTPFVRKCAPGFHYNAKLEICDYPHNANCKLDNDA
ncbi:peritrophin-1-like [Cochliomyia hominivorax]